MGTIGGAVGSTISGAVWNNILPDQLMEHVPGEFDVKKAAGSYLYVLTLPEDQYHGAVIAYGNSQKILSIIAVCLTVLSFVFTLPMRSFGLDEAIDRHFHKKKNEQQETISSSDGLYIFIIKKIVYYCNCSTKKKHILYFVFALYLC